MYFKTLLHPGLWGLYQIIEQSCNTLKHFDTEAPHLCNRVPSRHASLNFLNRAAHAQYDVYRLDLNANENEQLSYYTNKTIRTTAMLKWNICLILSNTFRFSLRTLQDSATVLLSCTFWTITIKSYKSFKINKETQSWSQFVPVHSRRTTRTPWTTEWLNEWQEKLRGRISKGANEWINRLN